MKQLLTDLVLLAALGCTSSTGPAGFTPHVEVVNKTTYPNYWANTPFSWQYLNGDVILDQGSIMIQSDSACITPPVAPPKTNRVWFYVPNSLNDFKPTQPDWTVTVTPVNFGTINWHRDWRTHAVGTGLRPSGHCLAPMRSSAAEVITHAG